MKQNKFTIITPSYNNEDWVEYNLASVLNQTYKNWSLFILDDNSSQEVFNVISTYLELNDDRIKYYNSLISEEDRKNKSIAAKKRWSRPGEKEKLSQKMIGNDYGKNKKGWIPAIETKERMRKAKKGKKQRRCCCVVCRQEVSVSNIVQHYNAHHKKRENFRSP